MEIPSLSADSLKGSFPSLSSLRKPSQGVPNDLVSLSPGLQNKLIKMGEGVSWLEQALKQAKRSPRDTALERVKQAAARLRRLKMMSASGDEFAAREAARLVREIASAANQYLAGDASPQGAQTAAQGGGVDMIQRNAFVSAAGDALGMATEIINTPPRKGGSLPGERASLVGAASAIDLIVRGGSANPRINFSGTLLMVMA